MLEIERKFLLKEEDDSWRAKASRKCDVLQGYLALGAATVRVRIQDGKAILCIKGHTRGITRSEFEYPIPLQDAQAMLMELCRGRIVTKTRYYVPAAEAGMTWEIDEYHGAFEGHHTAEIELPSEEAAFQRPRWLGKEISDDRRYRNAALASEQRWPTEE